MFLYILFWDRLLILNILQSVLFLLSVFLVLLLLSVGAAVVSEILGESSLQFPMSSLAAIRLHCAGLCFVRYLKLGEVISFESLQMLLKCAYGILYAILALTAG